MQCDVMRVCDVCSKAAERKLFLISHHHHHENLLDSGQHWQHSHRFRSVGSRQASQPLHQTNLSKKEKWIVSLVCFCWRNEIIVQCTHKNNFFATYYMPFDLQEWLGLLRSSFSFFWSPLIDPEILIAFFGCFSKGKICEITAEAIMIIRWSHKANGEKNDMHAHR